MNLTNYRAAVRDVECPACGAQSGSYCLSLSTGLVEEYVHDDRSLAHQGRVADGLDHALHGGELTDQQRLVAVSTVKNAIS